MYLDGHLGSRDDFLGTLRNKIHLSTDADMYVKYATGSGKDNQFDIDDEDDFKIFVEYLDSKDGADIKLVVETQCQTVTGNEDEVGI
ncbi:hypothetical protein BC938DRAFT_475659 [Jimgerdemannia flammicorona]|uniref:PB1 domain-containing protein n=1 Tax=Jimgerdemannia flammicorona TaxID=994334 RepID=A0A433PQP6_9FUNG|nr:hypothetical protein BC938DRAFT_475659 [Jimgerdemannia flammicorona]